MTILRSLIAPVAVAAALALAPAAQAAKLCKLEIAGNDLIQYDKKELKIAPDCTEVELTLKHTGKLPVTTMGHNWILTRTADVAAVMNAAVAAGPKANHVPAGDKRVIAATTPIVGGGQSAKIKFSTAGLKKGEDYTYFCGFPGHGAIMRGKFIIG
jgi:azurin